MFAEVSHWLLFQQRVSRIMVSVWKKKKKKGKVHGAAQFEFEQYIEIHQFGC